MVQADRSVELVRRQESVLPTSIQGLEVRTDYAGCLDSNYKPFACGLCKIDGIHCGRTDCCAGSRAADEPVLNSVGDVPEYRRTAQARKIPVSFFCWPIQGAGRTRAAN